MKGLGVVKGMVVSLAAVGFCLPQPLMAAAAAQPVPDAVDVALGDGGLLVGRIVDAQGVPLANVTVSLQSQDREIAATKTNPSGDFAFRGVRGGVYQVVAGQSHRSYRLWAPGTAPPSSHAGALLVAGGQTVRGQFVPGALGFWLSNPWIVAGLVATAAAVPVAIHNADDPSSP